MINVLAKGTCADIEGRRGALYSRVRDKARDVDLVGATRLNRCALLEGEEIVESLDEKSATQRIVQLDLIHALLRVVSIARFRLRE